MTPTARARAVLCRAVQVATLGSVVMLLLSVHELAAGAPAADGPQAAPSLAPESVATATDAFAVVPPPDARCGGSGADGWRWHTFIVEKGRDLSALRFGPFGPGDDYDATDGEITGGLIASGDGVWAKLPALKPEGLVNPNDLGGLVLDPSTYTLRDGDYELGVACTDGDVTTRQWWSTTVTIDTAGEPFLTVAGEGVAPAVPTTAPPSAAAPAVDPASVGGGTDQTTRGLREAATEPVTPAATSAAIDVPSPAGVTWAPLVALTAVPSRLPTPGWAALVAVLGRISFLLARPVRAAAPFSM